MSKKLIVVIACFVLAAVLLAEANAAPMFVATARNFRGALYLGYGPTPAHACECAVVKCSRDSFIPPSCKVVSVRMECPPPLCLPAPPPQKPIRKSVYKSAPMAPKGYPSGYPWGRPMP